MLLRVDSNPYSDVGKDKLTKSSRLHKLVVTNKTFGKIETANAIFWIYLGGKGQIISECPYEKIVCPKIATKKFLRFLP